MARKDVRLMLETAGGPGRLVVLPAVAAAMDQALAKGHGKDDYAIFARADAR
jgi:3-hydroxyisobutyrate dehydrogenase